MRPGERPHARSGGAPTNRERPKRDIDAGKAADASRQPGDTAPPRDKPTGAATGIGWLAFGVAAAIAVIAFLWARALEADA
jgi:hypothetical protein